MADGGVVGPEHAVREPVIAHKLPDVLNRLGPQSGSRFQALGRELHNHDVARHDQVLRQVPARLIDEQRAVFTRLYPGQISVRCRPIASVLHQGRTSPAASSVVGQIAPKMSVDAVRWSCGAQRRVPRFAQRRVILFF